MKNPVPELLRGSAVKMQRQFKAMLVQGSGLIPDLILMDGEFTWITLSPGQSWEFLLTVNS
jgi:hypothetical protein